MGRLPVENCGDLVIFDKDVVKPKVTVHQAGSIIAFWYVITQPMKGARQRRRLCYAATLGDVMPVLDILAIELGERGKPQTFLQVTVTDIVVARIEFGCVNLRQRFNQAADHCR